jgi:hypothetical protein
MSSTKNANNPTDQGRDPAGAFADTARDLTKTAVDKVDDAAGMVGEGLTSLARNVRDRAPHEGVLGSAAGAVASGIESTGRYLKDEGLSGMADDAVNLIRNHPIPALLVGVGLGFLLARALSRD